MTISVISTVAYLTELAAAVTCGSPAITIDTLVAAGTDPHTFALSPQTRGKISNSKYLMIVGSGFEPWIDKIKIGASQKKFTLTDGLPLENGDPHIWHSPKLTLQAAQKMGQFFAENNFVKIEVAQKCVEAFEKSVNTEVEVLKKQLQEVPKIDRILATDHDAFAYFGREFGIQIVSVTGLSTDAAPTPLQMKKVIEKIKLKKIKALFLEGGSSSRAIETVARETQVKIGGTLISDGLDAKGSGADTLFGLWRKNMSTFVVGIKESLK